MFAQEICGCRFFWPACPNRHLRNAKKTTAMSRAALNFERRTSGVRFVREDL